MSSTVDIATIRDELARSPTEQRAFEALEAQSRQLFDHILFTCLRFDYDRQVMARLYSNREDVMPTGGTKPMPSGVWADQLLSDGRAYIGNHREDLRTVFFDYEALWAIGCESTMNVPVRWRNRTVGSFNILARAGQFGAGSEELFRTSAQLSVPLFLQHEPA
jgi:hypothetical protein